MTSTTLLQSPSHATATNSIDATAANDATSTSATATPRQWAAFLKLPFSRSTWTRTLFIAAAAPLGVIALVDGGRLQQRAAAKLAGREIRATRLRGVPAMPIALAALPFIGYALDIVFLNICYPLRPLVGVSGFDPSAWGGPSYAGVWAVHALGGLATLFALPWILRGVTALQARILGRPRQAR